jgi:hypothetical protein
MVMLLENFVRYHDQLDEQLHAGFYFYVFTDIHKFVSNSISLWPLSAMMWGFLVPEMLARDMRESARRKRL